MAAETKELDQARQLIDDLYNSSDNEKLRALLMKGYQRLEDGADVADLMAHVASAVNYLRQTDQVSMTDSQMAIWRKIRDAGNAAVLYHDPKNNLLDLSDR